MKFLIIATLFAAASANSYDPTSTPAYPTPSAKANEAPSTYQPESYTPKPYNFSWQLNDAESYNNFAHSESSDGKVISGSYRVDLPDGRTQIVTYKDDSNGYVAIVNYEGEAKYPKYKPSASYAVPSYKSPAPVNQVLAGSSYQSSTTPSTTQYNTLATVAHKAPVTVATLPYTTRSKKEYKLLATRSYRAPTLRTRSLSRVSTTHWLDRWMLRFSSLTPMFSSAELKFTPSLKSSCPSAWLFLALSWLPPAFCLIGSETVTTFDGLFYNASFSGCDQVLTKDCSGRYKFAVLSRVEGDKKIVTVLLNKEKIEIFPAQQKVNVNGMEISVTSESYTVKNAENEVLAVIKKTADNFIEVDSPISHMIRVLTDAKEVVVMASPIHRGRLCGLCGSQNGDKVTDLTGPRQCAIPRDLMDVAYELRQPAGCKSDISSRDVAELRRIQEECLKEKSETVFGISDVSPLLPKFQQNIYSSQTFRRPSQWTVYRNKMVVQDNKRCFSTESVPKCAEGARAQETVEKKLGFHCLPKNILSEKLNEEMSSRPLDELMGKQVDMVRVYSVPTACLPF